MIHALYCALAIVGFSLFGVWGYGYLVTNKKLNLVLYRVMQGTLEIGIDALFVFTGLWWIAVGFELCHFSMGCDLLYYLFRGEDYSGYNITWFAASIPSLIFKIECKSFQGKYLTDIGWTAVFVGLAVSMF